MKPSIREQVFLIRSRRNGSFITICVGMEEIRSFAENVGLYHMSHCYTVHSVGPPMVVTEMDEVKISMEPMKEPEK